MGPVCLLIRGRFEETVRRWTSKKLEEEHAPRYPLRPPPLSGDQKKTPDRAATQVRLGGEITTAARVWCTWCTGRFDVRPPVAVSTVNTRRTCDMAASPGQVVIESTVRPPTLKLPTTSPAPSLRIHLHLIAGQIPNYDSDVLEIPPHASPPGRCIDVASILHAVQHALNASFIPVQVSSRRTTRGLRDCRIGPPQARRFLAECRKRRLNRVSLSCYIVFVVRVSWFALGCVFSRYF